MRNFDIAGFGTPRSGLSSPMMTPIFANICLFIDGDIDEQSA
jgi:hypothetical protein